jgi:LPS-assembly protein
LATLAFTSQLPSQPSQEVTMKALQQEEQGDVYKMDGDVEVLTQNYVIRADHGTYNQDTGELEATGRVVFDGGPHDAHITAAHATYNVQKETGIFYEVSGTFGAVVRGQTVVLTSNNPFVIAGREVHKVGRNRYIVLHGSITSCAEQVPKWTFNAEKIDLVAGEDAKIYHSTFRLLKLPVFYFPYNQLPASGMARTSGFMLPAVGDSSTKGFILGENVYWAINRSNDITLGAEYFSKRGWSQTVAFRTRPGENSSMEVHYFGVLDRGTLVQQQLPNGREQTVFQNQGGEEARLIGETSQDHWRASASVDYLSSFLFRQAFSESFTQAINSEVSSVVYLSHNLAGFSLNASAERYQNFYQDPTTDSYSNQIKILHLPMVEINGLEQRVYASPFVWAVDTSAGGMQRSEPGFVTANLVGRLDIRPRIAMPLHWMGWDLRPEIAVHDTLYSQQLTPATPANPLGVASGNELNRRDVEASIELRPPALEKVFDREIFGRRLKHVIETVFTYNYTAGVGNFQHIIRFDQNDILSNTSEFQYDVIQRIYGRRRSTHKEAGCEAALASAAESAAASGTKSAGRSGNQAGNQAGNQSGIPGQIEKFPTGYIPGVSVVRPHCEDESKTTRELLSWEVKQKYYINESFGGALVPGERNVFTSTDDLTGIAFLYGPRTWSPVVSKLRIETSANTDVQWQLDYDPVAGRINSSATFAEYRLGDYFFGLSHAFFHVPADALTQTIANEPVVFNQFRYLIGYGHPNKRGFSGGFSMGYDQNLGFLQSAAAQSSYNWDCCGVSFEYRHIDVPGVNVENEYRFAFSLANIGTAGNMRRQERLY